MKATSRGLLLLVAVGVIVGLPLAGHWARCSPAQRCALDGVAIDPRYGARIVDAAGQEHSFCCIECARLWLRQQQAAPRTVYVTDEVSGDEIDAAQAWLVRSQVVSVAATQNQLHAFRSRDDAERHARAALGRVLTADEDPFWSRHGGVVSAGRKLPEVGRGDR